MYIKQLSTALALVTVLVFTSCKKDDDKKNPDSNTSNPKVEATSPANNATDVALNKVVTVVFNEAMNPATFTNSSFTIKDGSTPIVGTITYTELTAIFEPSVALSSNTTYTATLTTAVKNTGGKPLASDVVWSFTTGTDAIGMQKVNLRTAENYVILVKTAINNSSTSAITGDIAISPSAATYITGFSLVHATGYATSSQITGKAFAADMADETAITLTTAVEDMLIAYNDASGRLNPDFNELSSGDIGGKTLMPGLYKWTNTVTAPTNLVISGSSSDVWIFQIAGDLTVSSGVTITLSGGAKPENIFWQVAGEVTLGTSSKFKGIILSMTGITLQTDAVLTGRALAQTAVILDANTVTQP